MNELLKIIGEPYSFVRELTLDEIEDIECKLTTIVHQLATYRKIIRDD